MNIKLVWTTIGGIMNKIAFVFPGQGAQHTGMGMDLYENSKAAKELINQADALLDFDLIDLCSNSEKPIDETSYTQPALVAISIALLNEFTNKTNIKPDYVAGLSLGEYSAHVAANSISFEDAITLVRKRGLYMEEAGKLTKGAMAAIVKGDVNKINSYCSEDPGIVVVANYNSPVQVVISGEEEAVLRVSQRLLAEKTRVIPLKVSGAFHSPLMASAAVKFKEDILNIEFKDFKVKHVTNVTGETIENKNQISDLLVKQLQSSVQWEKSIEYMIENGVTTFVEIGPGNTLAGLIKKINRKVKVYNVNTFDSVNEVAMQIKGE